MGGTIKTFLAIVAAALQCGVVVASPQCDRCLFESALANDSTSPSFVLVTVTDENTGAKREVCIGALFLLGALHRELGLGYRQAGVDAVKAAALKNETLEFRFFKKKALDNLKPSYTREILETVRAQLSDLSKDELLRGFSSPDGPMHHIYTGASDRRAFRDAVAHVLLERCIGVARADRSGMLEVGSDRLTKCCS